MQRKPVVSSHGTNVLQFRRSINTSTPEDPDPAPVMAGISPAVLKLEAKRGLVVVQFVQTDGDDRVVARRHGVRQEHVRRLVARAIKPVLAEILKEAA